MLIGLTARLQSGKDEAANYLVETRGYYRVAFADQLKVLAKKIGWNGEKDEYGRKLLQDLGVGAREVVGPDVWVNALEYSLRERGMDPETSKIVIPDVRFRNEHDWIKRHGGFVVKIFRPGIDRSGPEHQHSSETNVDLMPFDKTLVNDRGIEEYRQEIDAVLSRLARRAESVGVVGR